MVLIIIVIAVYLLVGGLLSNHLFRPSQPDFSSFFNKHRRLKSETEGVTMEIKKVENGWVHCRVEMAPFAAGPPIHIHETFDEWFMVESGTASMLVKGEKKILKSGEMLMIPKGTPHKPFNETNEVVILNDVSNQYATMPANFAYGLNFIYRAMDTFKGINRPKILLELAALGNDFDSWNAGSSILLQKCFRWILGPSARLLGFGDKS